VEASEEEEVEEAVGDLAEAAAVGAAAAEAAAGLDPDHPDLQHLPEVHPTDLEAVPVIPNSSGAAVVPSTVSLELPLVEEGS